MGYVNGFNRLTEPSSRSRYTESMTASSFSCILWDVDGTIADASRGFFSNLRTVLDVFEIEHPEIAEFKLWMGPPLIESFQNKAGLSLPQAVQALDHYRELSGAGSYAASVDLYPGVPELIHAVRAAGVPQSTASSKPEVKVREILEHFDLIHEFTAISGARSGEAGRYDGKSFVVGQALERLRAAGVDTSRPVLIGDRHHDVDGGEEHGVPVIFVDWGFGLAEESSGAIHHAMNVADLESLILAR